MRKIKIVNKKLIVFSFVLGLVISGGIAYAANQILASDISYRDGTVESALNDLYSKANSAGYVCILTSGTANQVGAKYACELGDGVARNFYVLKSNIDDVEMTMERNITDEILVNNSKMLSWNDAMVFFDEENPGYATAQIWLTKVKEVKLPDAVVLKNVGGATNLNLDSQGYMYFGGSANTRSGYAWLYNYTKNCESNGCSYGYSNVDGYPGGYWTTTEVSSGTSDAWRVDWDGMLSSGVKSTSNDRGVRPVVVVAKSKLAN